MASVTVYTADRMQAIEDSSVVSGTVDPVTKKLMLTTRGGTVIDGGVIQGAKGDKGDPGAGNVNTVNTKLGPDVVLTPADLGALPATQFATEAQRGIIELATTTEAAALTDPDRGITPFTLAHVKNQRWEKTGSTIAALGNGLFAGQTALLTLASNTFPVEIVWTGSRWEPVSWKLSGSNTQRSAFETSGVCYEGVEWYSTTDKLSYFWTGSAWRTALSGFTKLTNLPVVNSGGTVSNDGKGNLTFTNVITLTFDNLFTSAFKNYKLVLDSLSRLTTIGSINIQFRSAGSTISTNTYHLAANGQRIGSDMAPINYSVTGTNAMPVVYADKHTGLFKASTEIDFFTPRAARPVSLNMHGMIVASNGSLYTMIGGGATDGSMVRDGIVIAGNANDAFSGELSIYGYN